MLSPLFSNKNQTGGFFNNFTSQGLTPKGFTPKGFPTRGSLFTPRCIVEESKDSMKEESLIKPIPILRELDYNLKMDNVVDKLKEDIKNNSSSNSTDPGANNETKGLNLDIELINDSFAAPPLTKSPNMSSFQLSRPSSKTGFKKISDWISSPNASSFQLRKRVEN